MSQSGKPYGSGVVSFFRAASRSARIDRRTERNSQTAPAITRK